MTDADFSYPNLHTDSPWALWQAHCREGRLAYQATPEGRAVFHPRVAAPGTGEPLQWRISTGLGTVYATTVVRPRGDAPYNVALIDLDEGFRMMSRVEGVPPQDVTIGLRVAVRMVQEADGVTRPVFDPVGAT